MQLRKQLYLAHRWLGLAVSLQLLAWSVGGLLFTLLDIDEVHGDKNRSHRAAPSIDPGDIRLTPAEAILAARPGSGGRDTPIMRVVLRARLGRPVYELFDADGEAVATVDAQTGEPARRLVRSDAEMIAKDDFSPRDVAVRAATLIERDAPLEYRGKPLPAWQVILDHPKEPHIYVSADTGAVTARRNDAWRLWDFFWMLHIMDYGQRESFGHLLLTSFAALAVLTAVAGMVLHVWRIAARVRKKRDPPARRAGGALLRRW